MAISSCPFPKFKSQPAGIAAALAILATATPAIAQIVPDATLPNNSTVIPNGRGLTINGGTTAGSNLFHSFLEFSLPTDAEAFFNNATTIDNIITRVTGGTISHINGLIRANGNANLFLINPNGIVFGPNARLDIGGSFFASTADRLLLSDRTFYSATSPNTPPLLTVNVPLGLQWNGQNGGNIRVEGAGHNLTFQDFNGRVLRGESFSNLQVRSGNTLALIGGDITLAGATLTAPSGRIELGSVTEGMVTLVEENSDRDWRLGYEEAIALGDIQLLSQAAVDASGTGDSSIQVRGANLTMSDGSVMLIQNQGSQPTGNIAVEVTESVQLLGTTAQLSPFLPGTIPSVRMPSGLQTQTIAEVNGADIEISSEHLSLIDGAAIQTRNFSSTEASAGNIRVNASDSVVLSGNSPVLDLVISLINSTSLAQGSVGDIAINTNRLRILDGASVATFSLNGNLTGGNLTVNAVESVEIVGMEEQSPSGLAVLAARGRAGNLLVNTGRLLLRDAAAIASSSFDESSGTVEINASQEVSIGSTPQSSQRASISASVFVSNADDGLAGIFRPDQLPTGDGGDVRINSPLVRLSEGGEITVANQGTGRGGNVEVTSENLVLDSGGQIIASTMSGEGGNIFLQVANSLQLVGVGLVSAEAGEAGNGGNIRINTDTLALLENSRITANAFGGNGGNIAIATRGLFQSGNSAITASSALGLSGTVSITNPEIDPTSAIVELDVEFQDPSEQIATGCVAGENSFVVTGRGGLAEDPTASLNGRILWRDLADYTAGNIGQRRSPPNVLKPMGNLKYQPQSLVEATGWIEYSDGTIELVAWGEGRQNSLLLVDCNSLPD